MYYSFRRILLLASIAMLAVARPTLGADQAGSIKVDIAGVLRAGVVAIGGETTGVTISANGITWELDLGADRKFREDASRFDGEFVKVEGALERREGVETQERWIVKVSHLELAEHSTKPILEVETKRADSQVGITGSREHLVAEVRSKFGIGSATITRVGEQWPSAMTIRLHLRGLESFKVESGGTAVEWSKSSTGKQSSRVSLRRGGSEEPLAEGSPYHSKVKVVGGNGRIPLAGGYFEIALPLAIIEGNPKEIRIHWIDFYR